MAIQLIYARAANGVIGKDNTMPWHLPEDLAQFKPTDPGLRRRHGPQHLGQPARALSPLPGRTNIVVTRNTDWSRRSASRARQQPGRPQAEAAQHSATTSGCMGGAQIYAQALPLADAVEVTNIHKDFEGDAFAPELGPEWVEGERQA